MVAVGSKCRVCKAPAIIDLPRHNAHFCAEHFLEQCRRQVTKAIDEFDMIREGERVLVAVSGGKDSLALWDVLIDDGYQTTGLYLDLGIFDYSVALGIPGQVEDARVQDFIARATKIARAAGKAT